MMMTEEKEQAALLKQRVKVEQEKKEEMERLMQEEKVHHEQRLQQLQTKIEEEKIEQQEELSRAMESKMAEHKQLLQKGFDEKADMMKLEIEQLKKEKDEQSGVFFKDYVMPLVDTAKDVFSTVLQYKLVKKGLKMPF